MQLNSFKKHFVHLTAVSFVFCMESLLQLVLFAVLIFACGATNGAPSQVSDGLSDEGPYYDGGIIRQLPKADTSWSWIYEQGRFSVLPFSISTRNASMPLIVFAPKEAGTYPVIVFEHGFLLSNSNYSQILSHVSSHGFIIVAPQRREFIWNDNATSDIQNAAEVIEWLPNNLAASFPQELTHVMPNLRKLVIMGHSKGGKVAFGLALKIKSNVSLPFSALIALDPVDGSGESQTPPPILNFKNNSFNLAFPTLVIGTGLGPKSVLPFFPACAPAKLGHLQFYMDSSAPAFDFLALDYGHMDFVDAKTAACKQSSSGRAPLRKFTAGLVVAFLRAVLLNDSAAFEDAVNYPSHAPISIATPLVKVSNKMLYVYMYNYLNIT